MSDEIIVVECRSLLLDKEQEDRVCVCVTTTIGNIDILSHDIGCSM